jgi:capsular exopolysaccharide synthesis family protein
LRAGEQYRLLRTNILQHSARPKALAISSATPGDGKTISAINIAGILALKSEPTVLLVDADFRRGSIAKVLGLDASPGMSDILEGHCSIEKAIVRVEQLPNLHILPAGTTTSKPTELLDSALFRWLVKALRDQFSFVIFDTTPTAVVADFKLVQQVCDGVLLIVRPDHTDRRALLEALEMEPRDKLLGTVINNFEDWFLWKNDDNYYYPGESRKGKGPWGTDLRNHKAG